MITKILGLSITLGCLALVYFFEGSAAPGGFKILHWPAMVLTGVGPIGIVLLCSDWRAVRSAGRMLVSGSVNQVRKRNQTQALALHERGQLYYAEGARAFDAAMEGAGSDRVKRVVGKLSARMPVADVQAWLERDNARVQARFESALGLVGIGLRLAPSIGMLGTILGMVHLLANLTDPSGIGSHMSLALLTTFYGLFFSIVVWTPMQHKLEALKEAEEDGFEQSKHWLSLLEQRKPSQYFRESLEESRV